MCKCYDVTMLTDFRHFEAGPDPFGRTWQVQFLWLQTAISIRHSDTIDVKFKLRCGDTESEKVIALNHPEILQLAHKSGRPVTDAWCMKLGALHLKQMIETGEDIEKALVQPRFDELEHYNSLIERAAGARA